MIISYLQQLYWFFGLVLVQVLILNKIHILGFITPFLYIYFLLKLPTGISRNLLLLLGFILGITIDVFSNTPGINAAACVFLAFVRPTFLRLFTPRDMLDSIVPSFKSMGISSYIKYTIVSVFACLMALLTLEFFTFSTFGMLLLRVISCSALTVVCILAIESTRRR